MQTPLPMPIAVFPAAVCRSARLRGRALGAVVMWGGSWVSAVTSTAVLDGIPPGNGVSVGIPTAGSGNPGADRVLPTRTELAAVLPWPGLRRGSTVAVRGSVSVLFALLAEATADGAWAAVVGLPGVSLVAAAETGVELARLAVVPDPGPDSPEVIAALLDGLDLVAVGGTAGLPEQDARRLSARARNRGSVLLPFGSWPGAEVGLDCIDACWRGIGNGHGHLRERSVTLRSSGRGAASRPRTCRVLLPGSGGTPGGFDEQDDVAHTGDEAGTADRRSAPRLRSVAG